jgi:hypothetical protein
VLKEQKNLDIAALYFCGPTRSLIGGTLAVSQVNARQPNCQPSSIVASTDWLL